MNANTILAVAAAFAFLSVAIGAFGAHGLQSVLPAKQLQWIATGSTYQMYHALALFGVVLLIMIVGKSRALMCACYSFIIGVIFFSGSLYMLALTQIKAAVYLTPLGGICLLIGWAALIYSAVFQMGKKQ